MTKKITMIHSNHVAVEGDTITVDRKFLTGMRRYADSIRAEIATINPLNSTNKPIMDQVSVARKELGFELVTIDDRSSPNAISDVVKNQIAKSDLVYGYTNWNAPIISKELGIPYILVLEYDLKTHTRISTSQVSSPLRKISRSIKTTMRYLTVDCRAMLGATGLHCNGYPAYDESRWFNNQRLLYLDSRMLSEMIIPLEKLNHRFASRKGRPLRLLYSGRYEEMKGTLDAVHIALKCIQQGLDVELHCFGSGSLKNEMLALAAQAPAGRINIHDSIPYPTLVETSYKSDVFLCCHIQNDPSCTYLESFGAGLPIVGYGNRMWKRLCDESKAGHYSPIGNQQHVVESIKALTISHDKLNELSISAREFAIAHTFEREFKMRTDDLNFQLEKINS